MNPLSEHPVVRKTIYYLYWVVGVVLGAITAYFSFGGGDVPIVMLRIAAVYGFLAIPLGYTAGQNVQIDTYTGKHEALD